MKISAKKLRRQPLRSVALQMFVAGLPVDPELLAEFTHRKAHSLDQHHKSNNLFRRGNFLPIA